METIERKLCSVEENMVQRTLHNIYYNFKIAVRYRKPCFTLPDVKSLLVQLCNQWPQLVLQVHNNTVLRPLKLVKLGDVVVDLSERQYATDQEAIIGIFDEYTHYQFKYDSDSSSPLWKVLIYKDILIFVADHVLFDGTAGRLFHQFAGEYLEAQNGNVSQNGQCSYDDTIFRLSDHPNFIINPSAVELQQDFFPPSDWLPPKPISIAVPNFDKELLKLPLVNHYSTFYQIPKTLTSKLISVARANNVKITSVIYGLVSTSLMSAGILNGNELAAAIPINTRFKVKPQNGVLEYPFASLFATYMHLADIANSPSSFNDEKFWQYCQDFHKKLNASFEECLFSNGKTEQGFMSDPKLPLKTMQDLSSIERNTHPRATIVMSNLGAISSRKCAECWFDQSMVDAAFGCHLLGTPTEICINFTANRAISADDYNAYVKSSIGSFESISKVI